MLATCCKYIPRLAKKYGADDLVEEVVRGMRSQLTRETTYTRLSELRDLLALHGVEELQEDCVKKIHNIEVDEENFESLLKLAGDQDSYRQQVGDDDYFAINGCHTLGSARALKRRRNATTHYFTLVCSSRISPPVPAPSSCS